MGKVSGFLKKIGGAIVKNKAKSIAIGSVAAVALGGTAATVVVVSHHDHTPASAIVENYVPATYDANGSYDEVIYCFDCGEELERGSKTIDKLIATIANGKSAIHIHIANCFTSKFKSFI